MAREMKNSGVKWIGDIPINWEVLPNKYIMHKIKEICPIYNGEDILSLSVKGVNVRDLDAGGKMPATFNGYQRLHKGNLLMCLFDMDVTPCCIGRINNEGLTSPAYSQFVVHKGAHRDFYYYYYLMLDNTKELVHLAKNLRHTITEDQLGNIKLPLPPFPEQKAIADFLDKKCAEIDGLLADLEAEVKTLAEYKKSIIAETVTRGLNPNAPMKQSGIPWAETIPTHWEMFRLRFVVQIVSGYKNSSSIKVGLENIESWTGKYIPSETEFEGNGNYFGNNDILFGKLRPYLAKVYLAEFEGQAIGDFLVFRTKECAVPKYVKYFLLNPLVIGLINSFTYGAKMPRANWQDISKVLMPIPPIKEQEAIVAYLDEKCAIIDQSIADKQTQTETLKSYKASLIYEYVTGKKQVI